ncbi:MAG: hypothetical protein ACRCX2_01650 [Paraclostridium sp.]
MMKTYNAEDVARIIGCQISKAYKIIKNLNDNLVKNGVPKGCIVAGRVSKKLFHETLKI